MGLMKTKHIEEILNMTPDQALQEFDKSKLNMHHNDCLRKKGTCKLCQKAELIMDILDDSLKCTDCGNKLTVDEISENGNALVCYKCEANAVYKALYG